MKTRNNEDYVRIFHIYVYKHLVYGFLIAILSIGFLLFRQDFINLWKMITNQQEEWITYIYDDMALLDYSGNARIVNKDDQVVYEGMIINGKCNGKGTIYNQEGYKIYTGNLVDNIMEDEQGILYHKNEEPAYIGGMHQNTKHGEGTLYRDDGTLIYKGSFVNDHYEGSGMLYGEDGYILYEGDFVDGKYHGFGILYEEGDRTYKVYEGAFAFGEASGEGMLYDTFGKLYYKGEMVEGHINYTAYLPGTISEIEEHFLYPAKVYVYKDIVAFVIQECNLIFILDDTCKINKDEDDWKIDEQIKKEDILIKNIVLVGEDLDEPATLFQRDEIIQSWINETPPYDELALINAPDVFALALSMEPSYITQRASINKVKRGNELYEITTSIYDYKNIQSFQSGRVLFSYSYLNNNDIPLYSMMEEYTNGGVVK